MGHHGRVGTKAERVKCSKCRAKIMPGRAMNIHLAKAHDDKSKRFTVRRNGKRVPRPT